MNEAPLVTIVTAVWNNKKDMHSVIESVSGQDYPNIEYIVVDGGSTDGTLDVIRFYEDKISRWVSEKDQGIYDAINKGIRMARGEIVAILNSDDFYARKDVISKVVLALKQDNADVCWGDLVYIDPIESDKVIRYWKSMPFTSDAFTRGWVPPHPAFFVKKEIYEKYGLYDIDFSIAADYEMMLRLLEKNKCKSSYIPEILVKMRQGGVSNKSLHARIKSAQECLRAWKKNEIKINPVVPLIVRPLRKISQYFFKDVFNSR